VFTIKDIIRITSAENIYCDTNAKIDAISTDSRSIKRNELFLALKGEKSDGAKFIGEAVKKGTSAVVTEKQDEVSTRIPVIRVENTLKALSDLAKAHRKKFHIPVIGIVGSNGKTTTKDMLAFILGKKLTVLKTQDNLNNKIGVAKTLLRLRNEQIAVIEVGTSFTGEIEYNSAVLAPTVVITTNIGIAHLKSLGSRDGVLREKIAIVKSLGKRGVWIRNCDDEMLLKENYEDIRIIDFGIKNKRADFKAENIRQTAQGTQFFLNGKLIKLPLLGVHNVYNALAAITAASLFMDISKTKNTFADFKGTTMRMEAVNCGSFTIINDAYNSNPVSFECAVTSLKEYKSKGKKIICCADMHELGENSEKFHYNCGSFLAQAKAADFLIIFGDKALFIAKGATDNGMDKNRIKVFREKKDIPPFLRQILGRGDIVLIKGSRGMKMEEIVDCFTTCSVH
jgi:UDP-N-acetylmuramoyl-tripeptide--D-alanyl-D-alanine ligase